MCASSQPSTCDCWATVTSHTTFSTCGPLKLSKYQGTLFWAVAILWKLDGWVTLMLAVVFWSGHCLACDYTEIMSQVFYASTGRCPELAHIWRSLVFRELDLSLTYAQRNDVFVWVLPLHLGCSTGMYVRTAGLLLPAPEEYLGASFLLLPSFNEGSMGVYMVQFCLVTVWPLESSWFPTSPAAAEQIRCSSFWVSLGFAWPWKHKAGVLWWPLVVHGF